MEQPQRKATPGALEKARSMTALIVAVMLVVAFLIFVAVLSAGAGSSNSEVWQRRVYLFAGVEAVVFTAVGWLFGREVNRQQVDKATEQVEQADAKARYAEGKALEEATRAADLEARGEAAKAAIIARQTSFSDPQSGRSRSVFGSNAAAATGEFDELATFVKLLFPDQ